jgi:hypothetical protein
MKDLLRKVRRLRVYDREGDLWPLPFLRWEAEHFLDQATWEWPEWKGCPTDQMYFWTAEWQRGGRESLKALREGDYVEFDGPDPGEVVRWFAS